jgi:hypothetical protein
LFKKILSRICTCHPPRESSNQEACGEWAPQSQVPTYRDLHAHRYMVVVTPLIILPSHCCSHRIDDKCEIGTIIRALYNFSKPAVTAVRYPIRAGKFSNSHVPIRDWIVCAAGRFIPIHTSSEAKRSFLRGPQQSEWMQNSPQKHSVLQVICCSADKDMSINGYNRIETPKNRLFLVDRRIHT